MLSRARALRRPLMHPKEVALIEKYLTPRTVMLEWGSGGSTFHYGKQVGKLYSIEHDPKWGKAVRHWLGWHEGWAKLFRRKGPHIEHFIVEPNTGCPQRPSQSLDYRDYIDQVDRLGIECFDVVLIDGRARDHCAEKVLKYLGANSVVFIHDFFDPKRDYYRRVFQWYDRLDSVEDTLQTLVALRPKQRR
jgi:hypothetical protein